MSNLASRWSGAVSRIEQYVFGPLPIYPLIVCRVVFGLAYFVAYATRFPDVPALYGPEGLTGSDWLPLSIHPSVPLSGFFELVNTTLPPLEMWMIWANYAVLVPAAFCFCVGWRTRTSGVLLLVCHLFMIEVRNPYAYWGWASYTNALLLYLQFAPVGQFFSVDAWLRERRGAPRPAPEQWLTPGLPYRLVQFHIVMEYTNSGYDRLDDAGWIEGQMVYNALAHRFFARFPITDLEPLRPILTLGNYGAWVLEPVATIGLWFPWVGPLLAYSLIGMHVGLEILTCVGWWSYIMSAGLLCFVPTSHMEWLFRRLPGGIR